MSNTTQLDPADQTPPHVLAAIGENRKAFPSDACIPCGAVIHIGFFFDGFGRNRDLDDPLTSRYSNICRLWEAHRDNKDDRRKEQPNQFWYPFYSSGLGTVLNAEAQNALKGSALTKLAYEGAKTTADKATDIGKKIIGADRLSISPKSNLTDGFKKGLEEFSVRPVVQAYRDLVEDAKAIPKQIGRVWRLANDNRWVRRGKAAGRAIIYDLKKNPAKILNSVVRESVGVGLDSIPWFRDSRAVAGLLGKGVSDRLSAAMQQFEDAIAHTKLQMPQIQRIQVSIFGADRGGVLARALANELTSKYQHPGVATLAYIDWKHPNRPAIPIEIKFLGLLDAVSSLMEDNKLLGMLPVLGMIKQNYGDEPLAVPASVQRCVHFAAAHELRFYQRLDSLEKTRGVQYLYPGTSEDITGGAPTGNLGARAELQRVALRDMLNEAISHGAMLDTMEDQYEYKPDTFEKFTLANPIPDGASSYKISELIDAYREIVPYVSRLNFVEHMQVFLRWMAVRYQSQPFRSVVTSRLDTLVAKQRALLQERNNAEAAYLKLRGQTPVPDRVTLGKAVARWESAKAQLSDVTQDVLHEKRRPTEDVWDRIERESKGMMDRDARQASMLKYDTRFQQMAQRGELPWDANADATSDMIHSVMLSHNQEALVQAWKRGVSGSDPLPPKVMALFDLLVRDTMLTSWHDHLLSSNLYFRTRETDSFGVRDYIEEEREAMYAEQTVQRVEQLKASMQPIRPTANHR
ncbi:hypothetical protein [Pandoraea sp. NPDC087047]|uniref:hypothetical protein n=1 Tax=Pandoraea sp. NPDC087047 TaxID=3364390 RepID=UPI00382ABA15